MFADLNLDQVFAAVAAGRDEYDLTPFFRVPLHDARAVEYRHYLAGYTGSPAFTSLADDIARVTRLLGDVRYCVTIKGNRVRVTRYEGEADYSAEVEQAFAKFAENAAKDYRTGFRSWPEMNHVEEYILELVARLFPDVFQALDEFLARHDRYVDEKIRVFDREEPRPRSTLRRSATTSGSCDSAPAC
jgi:DNA mismatch repair protein MutS